jgi:hypothetical protein
MIKASNILESIDSILRLNERNISNPYDVDEFIEATIQQHPEMNGDIKQWIRSVVRNYLFNAYPRVELVTNKNKSKTVPYADLDTDWVKQGIQSRNLYCLNLRADAAVGFRTELFHVIDYLYALFDDDLPKDLQIRDLSRLSFDAASEKAAKWTKWLGEKESEGWEEGEETVMKTSDGFVMKKLTSEAALNREGKEMQHCVGSYADLVRNKRVTIYSLRDRSNNPHVTIEVRGDNVQQIKGKQNDAPIEKYHSAVIEFLNWINLDGALELENIDAIDYEGRFYHISRVPSSYWTRDDEGIDRLMNLATSNKLGPLEDILKAGVSPNVMNRYGHTMLYYACDRNRLNLVKMLLSYGADPNVWGDAPILKAAFLGERDIVNLLLDKGADVTLASGSDTEHLIHHCVKQGWYDEVEYILKHGERVDVRNYHDNTPLIIAAGKNDLRMVKLLLDYGADPTKKGNLDRLAVHCTNDPEIKELLKNDKSL